MTPELIQRIAADMQRGQAQQATATQPVAEQRASLGAANYSWANPLAMRVKLNSYNAKNLPFSEAGIGLSNYGWNEDNIFQQLETARRNYRSGDKTGGHHDVYKYMLDQIGTFSDPKQAQLMKQFMETGNVPSGLTMDTVMQVSDYGLRANARKQQRKKKGFLGGNIGAIIGAIGGAAIGFAIGGPAGAYAGAKAGGAAGGVGQAVNEDRGLLGTAMAGISGYGIGSLGASIGAAGQNLATNIGTRAAGQTAGQAARQSIQNSFTNALNQGIGSLKATLTDPFGAVRNFGTQFYQEAVNPFVQLGRGGIGSLKSVFNPATTLQSGFASGSGNFFSGGAQSAFAAPGRAMLAPRTYGGTQGFDIPDTNYEGVLTPETPFSEIRPNIDMNTGARLTDFTPSAEAVLTDTALGPLPIPSPTGGVTTYNPAAMPSGYTLPGTATPNFGTVSSTPFAPSATAGGLMVAGTAATAKDALRTPEEIAEDKGFFTEGNIDAGMLDLDEEGIGSGEGPQLGGYDFEGVGQPGAFISSEGYASLPRRQLPDYERGALGRRVFGGAPITLQNQFDLSPYFRSGFFKEGGAVDAGQHKGFPFMKQLPTGMQSKFQAYESGTQSITDSSGEQVEEGYTRVSGSGMEPVEERYVKTPMGIQEFFSRTPNGQFRLRV